MPEVTTLQAAAARGIHPGTFRNWVAKGKITPVGTRKVNGGETYLFDLDEVMAVTDRPSGRRVTAPPVELRVEVVPPAIAPGLADLERRGLFRPAGRGVVVGGGQLIGYVLIGGGWLRVCRAANGVVYHETTDWMDDDPDWADSYTETLEVLRAAA